MLIGNFFILLNTLGIFDFVVLHAIENGRRRRLPRDTRLILYDRTIGDQLSESSFCLILAPLADSGEFFAQFADPLFKTLVYFLRPTFLFLFCGFLLLPTFRSFNLLSRVSRIPLRCIVEEMGLYNVQPTTARCRSLVRARHSSEYRVVSFIRLTTFFSLCSQLSNSFHNSSVDLSFKSELSCWTGSG